MIGREEELRRDELIGHLDIRAYHAEHGEAIIDLKTWRAQIGAAWVQVGGYLWLDQQRIPWGGVLHVPRVAINKDVKGTLQLRPSGPLQTEWQRWQRRIREITDGATPTRSPGYHCGRCQLADCPVRIVGGETVKIHILNTPATEQENSLLKASILTFGDCALWWRR